MKKKPVPIRVRTVPTTHLRLTDWQSDPNLTSLGLKLLSTPDFQLVLALLRNESPAHYTPPQLGTSSEDRAAHQARTEGYELCLSNLEAIAQPGYDTAPVESTFAESDILPQVEQKL